MKYKVRKEEGIKKLELTKQNILRIEDILHELELQLEPLKEQAETARKYLTLRDKLKDIEINVYIDTIEKLKDRIKKHEDEYNSALDNKNALISKSEQVSTHSNERSNMLKVLEDKLEISRKDFYTLEANYEKGLSEINLNNEKISNFKQSIDRICNEISQLNEKSDNISGTINVYKNQLKDLNEKYKTVLAALSMKEKLREELVSFLDESEKSMEEMKTTHIEKLDLLSDKKVQIANIKSHIDSIEIRKNNIINEIDKIELDIEKEKTKKSIIEKNIQTLEEELKGSTSSLDTLIKLKRELDKTFVSENEKRESIKSGIQIKTSRYKMLHEMEQNLEGYNKTVKTFLQACNRIPSLGKGIRGALGQLVSVDKKYETALEMAVGSAIQNIVTETEEDAKAAIEYLKKKNLGRATFLPMSSVKGKYLNQKFINEIVNIPGFLGIGSDLVKYDTAYKNIILSLLGRVVVVENLDAGIAIAKRSGYSFRIVTLDGDILSTSGAISGGSKTTYNYGILSRSREIETLRKDTEDLKGKLLLVENSINTIISDLDETSGEIQKIQSNLKEKEMDRLRYESQLVHINENIKNWTAKIEMLQQEYHQNSRQEEEIKNELEKYREEQLKLENDIIRLKEIIDKYQEAQRNNISARDEILAEITSYKIHKLM